MITKLEIFENTINIVNQKFEIPEQIRKFYIIDDDIKNSKNWKCTKFFLPYNGEKGKEEENKLIGYILISLDSNHIIPINRNDEHQIGFESLDIVQHKYNVPYENYVSIAASSNFSYHYIYHINDKQEREEQLKAFKKYLEYGGNPNHKIMFYGTEESGGKDYVMTAKHFLETEGSFKKFQNIIVKSEEISEIGTELINKLEKLNTLWIEYTTTDREKRKEYLGDQIVDLADNLNHFLFMSDRIYSLLKDYFNLFYRKLKDAVSSNNVEKIGNILFSHNGIKNYIHIKIKENKSDVKEFFWNTQKAFAEFNRLSRIGEIK